MRNTRSTELIFELSKPGCSGAKLPQCDVPLHPVAELLPQEVLATKPLPLPELSEPDIVRHFVNLSTLNMSVDTHFYPLGSCTMKYNPKRNERIAGMPGFANLHPYQSDDTVQGMLELLYQSQQMLAEIAGLPAVSLATGGRGPGRADGPAGRGGLFPRRPASPKSVVLIPDGAHGTNPASAAMAGFDTVPVKSTPRRPDRPGRSPHAARRPRGRAHDHQSEHAGPLRDAHRRDRRDGPRRRRPGLSRRGQHERHPGHHPARRFRRRPDALQPAQDLQRPARRRRSRGRPDRRGREARPPICPSPMVVRQGDQLPAGLRSAPSRSAACGASSATSACWCGCTATFARTVRTGLRKIAENAVLNANYLLSRVKAHSAGAAGRSLHARVRGLGRADSRPSATSSAMDIAKRLLRLRLPRPHGLLPADRQGGDHDRADRDREQGHPGRLRGHAARASSARPREQLHDAPSSTPVSRPDEVQAARQPKLTWKPQAWHDRPGPLPTAPPRTRAAAPGIWPWTRCSWSGAEEEAERLPPFLPLERTDTLARVFPGLQRSPGTSVQPAVRDGATIDRRRRDPARFGVDLQYRPTGYPSIGNRP